MLTQSNSGASSFLKRMQKTIYKKLFFLKEWRFFPTQKIMQTLGKLPKKNWMNRRIQSDLTKVKKIKMSSGSFRELTLGSKGALVDHFVLFNVYQHQLFCEASPGFMTSSRFLIYERILKNLVRMHDFDGMQFVVYFGDSLNQHLLPNREAFPVFCFAKQRSDSTILIPDHEAVIGYKNLLKETQAASQKYPWEKKTPQVYWRGASTGGGFRSKETYQKAPRTVLVQRSFENPKWIDARFSHIVQVSSEVRESVQNAGFVDRKRSIEEHVKCRYQILIDGNTSSYSRAFWQLSSNCLMFKVDSNEVQWFYEELIPWKHFVPVKADLSDLLDKIEWANSHENQVRQIIFQANAFAQSHLSHSAVLQYLYSTLKLYSL